MKTEKKPLATRFFEAKSYVHFIVWWIIMFAMFNTFFYFTEPMLSLAKLSLASTIIAALFSLVFMGMNWQMKLSDKYYTQVDTFREQAAKSKDSNELIEIRKEVIKHHKEKSSHYAMGAASKSVVELIDTRLIYEFKVNIWKKDKS